MARLRTLLLCGIGLTGFVAGLVLSVEDMSLSKTTTGMAALFANLFIMAQLAKRAGDRE